MSYVNLDLYAQVAGGVCQRNAQPFFFSTPPPPFYEDGMPRSRRDVLCIEHLQLLNAGLCEFYKQRCGGEPITCPVDHPGIDRALLQCRDEHDNCGGFVAGGECGGIHCGC